MTHHVPEEILASYAAGASDEAEALLVATHLALCPRCRALCGSLDALGGALLSPGGPPEVAVAEDALSSLLARLDEPESPRPKLVPPAGPLDIPMPLRALTGPLAQVPFRATTPGIWRFDLPMSTRERPVALVSIRPGLSIPPHRHASTERGLVLQGGFTDDLGHYLRGDVSIRTSEDAHAHEQLIDEGERCVVFMVDDGPKLPTTALGRVVNFLFGL